MDTDLLKTFLEVSRTRHFGKAAENLYLTRSAVSFRVKQLEGILGVALFERQRNNIQPTPAGERMLGHAEAVLTAWERAKQDVSLSQLQSTQLAIGAGPNIWDAYLQGHLQDLHIGLPGVALRTEVLPLTVMTRQLMDRTLDIAISFDPPKLDQFELVQLGQINLLLVSSLADMAVDGVSSGQYVKVDWGTAFNIIHAQEYAALPVPSLHTSSARIALDFILNNGGCAFLPEHLIQPLLTKGMLHLVAGANAISRSVYVAYWAENDRLEQIKQAITFLIDDGQ
ncbi:MULTISPECIES: HTH-type transcriptional regulator HdfR [Shewanella]|uniref:Transcriptional regulator, LysR family n=3 Tax=Shewanella putrefaciens TaxID=24 RepID=E6XIY5_SHEP2|nr:MULTISPECIES: HTH-type transcriptional regulator HdfR [Shewanella]CAD6365465.1 HTH-type transcriptional regulator HdfR [Shewanella hafniensis]ABM25103.1 transcriptional regulator, LysR family [Shewanella sp. W3-18-1]AVV82577.1 LysR family transcriptional regulator [Shewanella putrefaciens]MCA1895781.1 HTH-type transcriptional regulator HdfR [Shewanella putrefaciens]MCT8941943.1 HTH-type transcriptional regulator HdfR [Shewanella putrefaciens]